MGTYNPGNPHNAGKTFNDNLTSSFLKDYPITKAEYFGKAGNLSSVREIQSADAYATVQDFADRISKGSTATKSIAHGWVATLADGTRITYRVVTSSKGSPAIDINIEKGSYKGEVKTQKIHFITDKHKEGRKEINEIKITTGFNEKDISILRNFAGKRLIKMRHDTFDVDSTVMCVVELDFGSSTYCIINNLDVIRYYSCPVEDIPCFHIHEGTSPYDMIKLIDDAIEATIDRISIVTDTVNAIKKDGTETFINTITSGVIFTFSDGHELGFERYSDFIEGIDIHKGYSVMGQFEEPEYWLDGLEEDFDATVERSISVLE